MSYIVPWSLTWPCKARFPATAFLCSHRQVATKFLAEDSEWCSPLFLKFLDTIQSPEPGLIVWGSFQGHCS